MDIKIIIFWLLKSENIVWAEMLFKWMYKEVHKDVYVEAFTAIPESIKVRG